MIEKSIGTKESAYHLELISLYLSGLPTGVIVGSIISPLLFIYALQDYIPSYLLISLFMYSVFVSVFRVMIPRVIKFDSENGDKYIKYTIFSTALSGLIWSSASVLVYIYAPIEYLFFTTTLLVGLVAAALTSLTPIFKAFIAYILFGILPVVLIYFLVDGRLYTIVAILIIFFIIFIIVGGYKHYRKLHEMITLKDQLKLLNNNLEGEVKTRTVELEELNSSLEDKVANEIDKNRVKDQQMLEQSRMAQMGEMISMIAHQWRQPLGAISSTSIDLRMKMMLESYDLDDKEQQKECTAYLDQQLVNVEGYVQSLTQTIDDFRNFYKPDKKQKVGLVNEPIQKSLNIIRATAVSNGIEIIESYESKQKLELFDSELMQVFLNIFKNAQDNFKEKSIESAKIIINTTDIENGVKIEICDNGGGIPADIVAKIFNPYFSTKSEKNGTGLGLYMSKTIIEEHHNGKLSVENRDGGACFIITLLDK